MILCEHPYPKILDEIKASLSKADVELVLVSAKDMREINLAQRGIDKSTDVLSFPLHALKNCPLGSIVINKELAEQSAKELGHSVDDELALLFTHGLLHILGYDHENDTGQMRAKEQEIIKSFNLPASLIIRNS